MNVSEIRARSWQVLGRAVLGHARLVRALCLVMSEAQQRRERICRASQSYRLQGFRFWLSIGGKKGHGPGIMITFSQTGQAGQRKIRSVRIVLVIGASI